MVQVIVKHKVKDFDAWLPRFHDHEPTRRAFGSTGGSVFRNLADPNDIHLHLGWSTPEAFHAFLEESDLKEAMAAAGVLGAPEITLLTERVAQDGAVQGAQSNKDAVRTYIDSVCGNGELGLIDDIYAPSYRNMTAPPGLPPGRDGLRALVTMLRTAFPDVRAKLVHLVSEGDLVTWHVEMTGTHAGEFMGVPATGSRVTWRAMSVDRFEKGRIVERWEQFDLFGLLMQIGGLPKA